MAGAFWLASQADLLEQTPHGEVFACAPAIWMGTFVRWSANGLDVSHRRIVFIKSVVCCCGANGQLQAEWWLTRVCLHILCARRVAVMLFMCRRQRRKTSLRVLGSLFHSSRDGGFGRTLRVLDWNPIEHEVRRARAGGNHGVTVGFGPQTRHVTSLKAELRDDIRLCLWAHMRSQVQKNVDLFRSSIRSAMVRHRIHDLRQRERVPRLNAFPLVERRPQTGWDKMLPRLW